MSRSSDVEDIVRVIDEAFVGAPPKTKKRAVYKFAKQIAEGRVVVRTIDATRAARTHRGDMTVSAALQMGVVGSAVLILMSRAGGPSLEDQARELMTYVLKQYEKANEWIPGPGKPVPVLGSKPKGPKKAGNRPRSRSPGPIEISDAPKPLRRGSAKAKKAKD